MQISKELYGLCKYYDELNRMIRENHATMQMVKSTFVKDYDENDYGQYYKFMSDMQRLQRERDRINDNKNALELYVQAKYSFSLFDDYYMNRAEIEVEE